MRHELTHIPLAERENSHKCPHCTYSSNDKSNLDRHVLAIHEQSEPMEIDPVISIEEESTIMAAPEATTNQQVFEMEEQMQIDQTSENGCELHQIEESFSDPNIQHFPSNFIKAIRLYPPFQRHKAVKQASLEIDWNQKFCAVCYGLFDNERDFFEHHDFSAGISQRSLFIKHSSACVRRDRRQRSRVLKENIAKYQKLVKVHLPNIENSMLIKKTSPKNSAL